MSCVTLSPAPRRGHNRSADGDSVSHRTNEWTLDFGALGAVDRALEFVVMSADFELTQAQLERPPDRRLRRDLVTQGDRDHTLTRLPREVQVVFHARRDGSRIGSPMGARWGSVVERGRGTPRARQR